MSVFFVGGIDTDAGKSYATGMMARYLHKRKIRIITQKLVQTELNSAWPKIYCCTAHMV